MLVVKTQPVTQQPATRPRLAELKPVNENITVNYAARQSDAQQRVPLEPLFQINTDAAAMAQPMSIDEASENLSTKPDVHSPAVREGMNQAALLLPAGQDGDTNSLQAAVKTESPLSGPVKLSSSQRRCACVAFTQLQTAAAE